MVDAKQCAPPLNARVAGRFVLMLSHHFEDVLGMGKGSVITIFGVSMRSLSDRTTERCREEPTAASRTTTGRLSSSLCVIPWLVSTLGVSPRANAKLCRGERASGRGCAL